MLRAQRYGRSLALIVFDLDDFKTVNDRVGHLAGDGVLAQVAEGLRQAVRSVDIACRVGGDEFAVILPESGIADANQLFRRVQESMRDTRPARTAACISRPASPSSSTATPPLRCSSALTPPSTAQRTRARTARTSRARRRPSMGQTFWSDPILTRQDGKSGLAGRPDPGSLRDQCRRVAGAGRSAGALERDCHDRTTLDGRT